MIKAISENMRRAILKSIGWFPFFDGHKARPIFIQVRPLCFPTCYEFIWSGNVLIYLKCVVFSLRLYPNTHTLTHSHRHPIMAFYCSSVLANCCVWPASQSTSRQVAGYVLFFCKSNQHKVLETGNFPNWAACRSQWSTKALLLVRKEREKRGRGREEGVRDENRQCLCLCMCVCVGVCKCLVPRSYPRSNLRPQQRCLVSPKPEAMSSSLRS